jgi:hypothetical protein
MKSRQRTRCPGGPKRLRVHEGVGAENGGSVNRAFMPPMLCRRTRRSSRQGW